MFSLLDRLVLYIEFSNMIIPHAPPLCPSAYPLTFSLLPTVFLSPVLLPLPLSLFLPLCLFLPLSISLFLPLSLPLRLSPQQKNKYLPVGTCSCQGKGKYYVHGISKDSNNQGNVCLIFLWNLAFIRANINIFEQRRSSRSTLKMTFIPSPLNNRLSVSEEILNLILVKKIKRNKEMYTGS